jgi:hypothetical protein
VTNLNVDSLDGADWASPAALGSTTPAAVSATTLSASGNVTLSGGTANGVAYLNGSKVVTSGSALTFDGTNLGLGVTPNAWGSGQKAFQIGATGALYTPADRYLSLGSNFYDNGTNGIYLTTGHATNYQQNRTSGVHAWYNAPSGTAGNAITFTQAMTLDASGNLMVGTTTPTANCKLTVTGAGISIAGGRGSTFALAYPDWSIYNTSSGNALAFDNGTERARIDSSGNLLVGTTSADPIGAKVQGTCITGNGNQVNAMANGTRAGAFGRYTSTGALIDLFYYGGSLTSVGSISTDGTNTTYGTSSDYRLKNTISPMTGALAKVAQLKPVTYKWNADGSNGEGFIAHELAEVCPNAVTGTKDAVDAEGNPKYQGIDTSFLVATLTAALQEAHGLIKNLETRISALEAK